MDKEKLELIISNADEVNEILNQVFDAIVDDVNYLQLSTKVMIAKTEVLRIKAAAMHLEIDDMKLKLNIK